MFIFRKDSSPRGEIDYHISRSTNNNFRNRTASPMKRLLFLALLVQPHFVAAQDRPLPAKEAAKAMTLPDGFKATLFAGEPDVVQPIAMTFDDRGRLWVVECRSYPKWLEKGEGADAVVMFEDTNGDGTFDKRHVVLDKQTNLSSVELGFGGIWLLSIPNMLFVPCDFNADTPKAGKAEVVLDGWSLKCRHNVVNSLTWGPDGWLYGCNGIIDTSFVGKPGAEKKDRVPMNCGVWRYHPTRKVFEPFAHGTTNPFGLDFNDVGECFITNCVIGHLWHVIQGGHYERMYGEDLNKNTYQLMKTTADHIHWGGGNWTTSRGGKGVHSEAGGGHAHVGCMVYLGDNWPDKYRNGVFMLNLHGNRINHDRLEVAGSTYVGKHEPDFMLANDPWFRGIAIRYGPDGGVYASDWTDTGECHNYDKADMTNGRIYKITYGTPKVWKGDLSKLSDVELVAMHSHKNDWQVRHARRILQERTLTAKLDPKAEAELRKGTADPNSQINKLRNIWTLHVCGLFREDDYARLFRQDPSSIVGAWLIRLGADSMPLSDSFSASIVELAQTSTGDVISRAIASVLPKLPVDVRFKVLLASRPHVERILDPNLTLLTWYGMEGLLAADRETALKFFAHLQSPTLQRFTSRRLLSDGPIEKNVEPLLSMLIESKDESSHLNVLLGIQDAVGGLRSLQTPANWPKAYARLMADKRPETKALATRLAVIFGDKNAVVELKKIAVDRATTTSKRYDALQALLVRQDAELVPLLRDLLEDKAMRGSAIRGLAAFKNEETPKLLLAIFPKLNEAEKADVVQTLASRPTWSLQLLDAVENKQVQRADVSVFVARQIQGHKDKQVQERLAKVWGKIQPASKEKAEQIVKFKKLLTPEYMKNADLVKGREVFAKNCAACHRLYNEGGDIGPALTGSQRSNLEYILENVLDPSAVVAREYQMVKIETQSGRTINGIVKQETDKAITIQTPNENIVVPKDEVESRAQSQLSMMPEGALDKLKPDEIRDLIAYLASKNPVDPPKKP